ncbi:MAG: hypothetical protein ACTHK3_08545 [Solirubrobacterales bacterium]
MWSDKWLDDLAQKVDSGFERVDTDIRELRTLMFQLWGVNIFAVLATLAAVIATS